MVERVYRSQTPYEGGSQDRRQSPLAERVAKAVSGAEGLVVVGTTVRESPLPEYDDQSKPGDWAIRYYHVLVAPRTPATRAQYAVLDRAVGEALKEAGIEPGFATGIEDRRMPGQVVPNIDVSVPTRYIDERTPVVTTRQRWGDRGQYSRLAVDYTFNQDLLTGEVVDLKSGKEGAVQRTILSLYPSVELAEAIIEHDTAVWGTPKANNAFIDRASYAVSPDHFAQG